jgi:hypothetical protein
LEPVFTITVFSDSYHYLFSWEQGAEQKRSPGADYFPQGTKADESPVALSNFTSRLPLLELLAELRAEGWVLPAFSRLQVS